MKRRKESNCENQETFSISVYLLWITLINYFDFEIFQLEFGSKISKFIRFVIKLDITFNGHFIPKT